MRFLKEIFGEFSDDNCPSMAAALAYYTIFSLPPLLVIVLFIAGSIFSPEQIEQQIVGQFSSALGEDGARQINTMMQNASEKARTGGILPLLLSIGGLLFGATGAFAQLQKTLNRAWEVEPDPERGGLTNFLTKRVLSLGMILVIAFLLLVSLIVSAVISGMGQYLADALPGGAGPVFLWFVDLGLSLAIVTLLFAAIYKVLPDARISWSDVWVGSFVTAALFVIGKFAISFYLGQSNPGEAFGAAGSLAVLLVWVYYSAIIVFLGAEFTQVWAREHGEGIRPDEGAVRVITETRRERVGADGSSPSARSGVNAPQS